MRINRLRLRGFIGIEEGLGTDEIDIDFSNLQGLVAIAGPNGNGKTTILDSMQPFRTLASRKRSLQHHVFLRDSEKELEFNFNGDQYRSLIKIDADSDRSEGYLWKNGESLVDGKVTNYDQEIIRLFGSPELFFNSVFCAQNSKKLNELRTGELKKLFSEFLRLDQLIEYENTSKQCAIILGNKLDAIETDIDRLTQTTRDKEDTAIKLSSATTQLEMAAVNLKKLEEELETKAAELQKAHASIQKNEMLRDREKELRAEREALVKEIEGHKKKVETNIADIAVQNSKLGVDIVLQDSLLANEREIRDAVKQVGELKIKTEGVAELGEKERSRERELVGQWEASHKEVENASKDFSALQTKVRDEIVKVENNIKIYKTRMVELEKKDPECTSTICSFIVGALEAEKLLPELEKNLSSWIAKEKKIKQEADWQTDLLKTALGDVMAKLKASRVNIKGLKDEYRELDAKIKELQPLANDLPKVEIATQRRSDLMKRMEELKKQQKKIRVDAKITNEELGQKRLSIHGKLDEVQKQIDNGADERVINIRNRSDDLTTAIKAYNDDALPKLKADIAAYGRRLEEIEVAENEWEKAKILADIYKNEIREWTYLKNACSKDGLRALEIDSVAPVVTGYANDLLISTFGPSSTIRFRTQDEETGREVLDILVIREDGTEVLLDDLSGGEKVYNLKALRLAMTLVSKEKSGMNFLCAMADEEDGALDVENAINFVGLYRSFMKSGQFDTCFYISHKPDCVAMADHVISLNGNGIEID